MYIWESKRDLLYFKNRETLRKAIEEAKGNGEFVISKMAEELLDTLAKNSIALEAKYVKDTQQHDD
jgi:hypothetical protein